MTIPLTNDAATAWGVVRQQLAEAKRQLERMRVKCVDRTVNSSDVLDGLWSALPVWRQRIDDATAGVTGLQGYVRTVTDNPTYDLATDWTNLKADVSALVTAIRNDSNLFVQSGPDAGTEANTIEDVNGVRRAKVYAAGEMDYLIPLIDACLIHLG